MTVFPPAPSRRERAAGEPPPRVPLEPMQRKAARWAGGVSNALVAFGFVLAVAAAGYLWVRAMAMEQFSAAAAELMGESQLTAVLSATGVIMLGVASMVAGVMLGIARARREGLRHPIAVVWGSLAIVRASSVLVPLLEGAALILGVLVGLNDTRGLTAELPSTQMPPVLSQEVTEMLESLTLAASGMVVGCLLAQAAIGMVLAQGIAHLGQPREGDATLSAGDWPR